MTTIAGTVTNCQSTNIQGNVHFGGSQWQLVGGGDVSGSSWGDINDDTLTLICQFLNMLQTVLQHHFFVWVSCRPHRHHHHRRDEDHHRYYGCDSHLCGGSNHAFWCRRSVMDEQ